MLDSQEIFALIQDIIETSRAYEKSGEVAHKDGYLPEYWNGYNESIQCMDKIKVHSEKGYFPEGLFENRSPNQTEEELCWIRDNYKQITLDVFNDYINTRGRAWHKSNWSISYHEDEDRFVNVPFSDFVERGIKTFGSVERYFQEVVPVLKAKDPEGVIVIKPHSVPLVEGEEGMRMSDTELTEPQPKYYSSEQIVAQSEDYYVIETGEKSIVEYGNNRKRIGRVFEVYDRNAIWIVTQVGKKVENRFELELFFKHDIGTIPVHKLLGIPKMIGCDVRWESPFLHAVDNLDLVLLDSSHLQMSKAKSTYPVRIMAANECDYSEGGYSCQAGSIGYYHEGAEGRKTCPSCNGSGLRHRLSPLGEIMFNPKEFDEGNSNRKLLEYVAPDVSTLEFLQDQIEKNEDRARRILHLTTTRDRASGNERSATEMSLENKALIAFIKNIADQEFQLFAWALEVIGEMRYGSLFAGFTLHRPTNFDFVTEEDYLSQISMAKEAGVPPLAIRFILTKYVKSIFGNSNTNDVIDLIIHSDRLLELGNEEIAMKRISGLVAPWEDVLHCSGISLINQLIIEVEGFLDLGFVEQRELLERRARQVADELSGDNEIERIASVE